MLMETTRWDPGTAWGQEDTGQACGSGREGFPGDSTSPEGAQGEEAQELPDKGTAHAMA